MPALERPDGCTLYDSRVICAYLDDRAGAGLYPQGASRWDTLTLEATADGILDAALAMVYEGKLRPEDKRMSEWVEGQWGKVERACKTLNNQWAAHLAGPLDMGQIALGCALGYVDFRHGRNDIATIAVFLPRCGAVDPRCAALTSGRARSIPVDSGEKSGGKVTPPLCLSAKVGQELE